MKRQQSQRMAINFNYDYPQVAREAGFQLRQYKDGPLDWRLMGSLEVERILHDQCLEQLDSVLKHLSEAPLGSMLETNILDSGIAKYFVLSQFSIQYLLFCRTFLDETVVELRESHAASQLEVTRLKQALAEANNEILQLHKRMTQMEAIHEVVYPCHLCSKSFVSNEALNVHISRKHMGKGAGVVSMSSAGAGAGSGIADAERSRDQKDREHDLNLINTIKLELEIKRLKERLNNAEREIKERSSLNSKRVTPREQRGETATATMIDVARVSVGIQNNLMDAKEKDESNSIASDESELRERKEQLAQMQAQMHSFEEWRESLSTNTRESIDEINRKLSDIVQALEIVQSLRHKAEPMEAVAAESVNIQRALSPVVEDLERLFSEKVVEMGKASAQKLEEVVKQMENKYIEQLSKLEHELLRDRAEEQDKKAHNAQKEEAGACENPSAASAETVECAVERQEAAKAKFTRTLLATKTKTIEVPLQSKTNDITFVIETDAKVDKLKSDTAAAIKELHSQPSSESQHTFVKSEQHRGEFQTLPPKWHETNSTDVSEMLSDDERTQLEDELDQRASKKDIGKARETKIKKVTTVAPPKQYTRKDARKLFNRNLQLHGIDLESKSLSDATMKQISAEIAEHRHNQKQKYANFYATRNRIKKFVDKLCSAKLPASAELMLNSTIIMQPAEAPPTRRLQLGKLDLSKASFEEQEPEASTPLQERQTTGVDNFKERLERILVLPMSSPATAATQQITADVHVREQIKPSPIPLPRKRVMFNTREQHGADLLLNKNL